MNVRGLWILVALAPCVAAASDERALHQRLDANGDGVVSMNEVPSDQQALWKRLVRISDRDGDGSLSLSEFERGLRGDTIERQLPIDENLVEDRLIQLFDYLDRDGDGRVAVKDVPDEYRDRFKRLLTAADSDRDGILTTEELRRLPRRAAALEEAPAMGGRLVGRFLRQADKDSDEKLSRREAPPVLRRQFDDADKDNDGYLSFQEARAALARRRMAERSNNQLIERD